VPTKPRGDELEKRLDAADNASRKLTKRMHGLSEALAAQRKRTEANWDAATAKMRAAWVPGRDADRRVTATKHEPERRHH
jgi:hypothetical protein